MEEKDNRPIIALMYDFDRTLCTKDMQEFTFIPNLHMEPELFWAKASRLSDEEGMDRVLAYMYLMLREANAAEQPIKRDAFVELGKDLELYPGVAEWFDVINAYGAERGAAVEHYIISSGLREIIEGCSIFGRFKEVFACEFFYDVNGVAKWPKNAVNYTTKTQFLFRINKGVLELNDDESLNRYTPRDIRRIPFNNMIYIGDGYTDVPCMRLVKEYGGYSIGVYDDRTDVAADLLRDGRVNFVEAADYRDGGHLMKTVREIIDKIVAENKLISESRIQEDRFQ